MFYIKKEFIKSNLALYLSLILVIGSSFQISSTDFFENNDHILIKIPSLYAQDDNGDENGYDNGATSLLITFTGDTFQIEKGAQINVLNKATGDYVSVHTLKDYDPTHNTEVELNRPWPVGSDYRVCVGPKNSDQLIACQEYNIAGTGERQIEFDIGSGGVVSSSTTSNNKTPKEEKSHEQQLRKMGIGYNDYDGDGITCAFTDAYANYFIKLVLDSQRLLGKQITEEYVEDLKETYYPSLTPQYIQKIKDCEQEEKDRKFGGISSPSTAGPFLGPSGPSINSQEELKQSGRSTCGLYGELCPAEPEEPYETCGVYGELCP